MHASVTPEAHSPKDDNSMNLNQLVGIALLVVGAILVYFGYAASQGVGEQISQTLTGRFTDSTTWYFILGAASLLGGFFLIAFRQNR